MPTVLRLCRENPREVPATGSGSQRYFDPEVLPALRRLYEAEVRRERGPMAGVWVREAAREPAGGPEVAPEVLVERAAEDLEERVEALTRRLEVLAVEVREAVEFLRRARRAEVRFL